MRKLEHLSDEELRRYYQMMSEGMSKSRRFSMIKEHNYDVKFAYHVVRLIAEVEMILVEHDLDITRNREQLKAIRRGEWELDYLKSWFEDKERALETTYAESTLRNSPDIEALRQLLLDCLEHHYGDLSTAVKRDVSVDAVLAEMQKVIDRHS